MFQTALAPPRVPPQMSRAAGAGGPGPPGAPAACPVGQAPGAGAESAPQGRCWGAAGGRRPRSSSASTPPVQVSINSIIFITGFSNISVVVIILILIIHLFCPVSTVDGQWLPWVTWSNCSGGCGGVEVRHRGCSPPQNGGRDCPQLPGEAGLALEISESG